MMRISNVAEWHTAQTTNLFGALSEFFCFTYLLSLSELLGFAYLLSLSELLGFTYLLSNLVELQLGSCRTD